MKTNYFSLFVPSSISYQWVVKINISRKDKDLEKRKLHTVKKIRSLDKYLKEKKIINKLKLLLAPKKRLLSVLG
jgi:hypothetical protein